MKSYATHAVEETFAIGLSLGQSAHKGDVIALYGGLGAGKTVLAKGIAKGLGIDDDITSPTFTLLRQYQGRLTLCHFDLYRIEDEQELEHIGFYDYLGGDYVCVIEWPQNAAELNADITVCIEGSGSDARQITISKKEEQNDHTRG